MLTACLIESEGIAHKIVGGRIIRADIRAADEDIYSMVGSRCESVLHFWRKSLARTRIVWYIMFQTCNIVYDIELFYHFVWQKLECLLGTRTETEVANACYGLSVNKSVVSCISHDNLAFKFGRTISQVSVCFASCLSGIKKTCLPQYSAVYP